LWLLFFVEEVPPIFGMLYIVPEKFGASDPPYLPAFGDKNDWLCRVIIGIFMPELEFLLILGLM
jgi:hypothetical protein